MAARFEEAGHQVRLVTWSLNSAADTFPYDIVRKPSALRLIREHRWADVVFENQVCLRLAWPAALLRRPTVIALNTWIARADGSIAFQDRIKRLWLGRAKAVIAVSDAVRKKCWQNAVVIGNPYRDELFQTRTEINRNRDFVFLGRLVSDKGVNMTIQALHELNASRLGDDRLCLTVVGDGPEREGLESLVQDLSMTDCVTFTGALRGEELVDCLNRHRFLWVPSRWEEPFGNVALEGMACGCIPVASDGGGLPDAVGDAGLVFNRRDLADMVAVTERLLDDALLCQRLIDNGKRHLELHRPEHVATQYLQVIDEAFAHRKH